MASFVIHSSESEDGESTYSSSFDEATDSNSESHVRSMNNVIKGAIPNETLESNDHSLLDDSYSEFSNASGEYGVRSATAEAAATLKQQFPGHLDDEVHSNDDYSAEFSDSGETLSSSDEHNQNDMVTLKPKLEEIEPRSMDSDTSYSSFSTHHEASFSNTPSESSSNSTSSKGILDPVFDDTHTVTKVTDDIHKQVLALERRNAILESELRIRASQLEQLSNMNMQQLAQKTERASRRRKEHMDQLDKVMREKTQAETLLQTERSKNLELKTQLDDSRRNEAALRKDIKELVTSRDTTRGRLADCMKECEQLRNELQHEQREYQEKVKAIREACELEVQQLRTSKQHLREKFEEERNNMLEKCMKEVRAESTRLQELTKVVESQFDECSVERGRIAAFKEQVEARNNQCEESAMRMRECLLKEIESERKLLRTELEKCRNERFQASKVERELTARLSEEIRLVETSKEEIRRGQQEVQVEKIKLETEQAKLRTEKECIDMLRQQMNDQLNSAKEQMLEVSTERRELQRQFENLEKTSEQVHAQQNELVARTALFEREATALFRDKAILNAQLQTIRQTQGSKWQQITNETISNVGLYQLQETTEYENKDNECKWDSNTYSNLSTQIEKVQPTRDLIQNQVSSPLEIVNQVTRFVDEMDCNPPCVEKIDYNGQAFDAAAAPSPPPVTYSAAMYEDVNREADALISLVFNPSFSFTQP